MLTISSFHMLICPLSLLQLGGESGVTNPQVEKMKFFFRCMAIMLVPVTASFPTVSKNNGLAILIYFTFCPSLFYFLSFSQGLFMYWLTSSVFSLSQILILKIPSVRTVFKIPKVVKHPVNTEAGRPGSGLMKQLKDCEYTHTRTQVICVHQYPVKQYI